MIICQLPRLAAAPALLLVALRLSAATPATTDVSKQALAAQANLQADSQEHVFVDMHAGDAPEPLHLAIGRSLVLTTKTPLKRIYIGNSTVLQSFASGPQEIVLTAKSYGLSSLVLWDTAGRYHMYSFSSDVDSEGIRSTFGAAFPDAAIHVDAREGKLFLSGDVPTDAMFDAASKMAASYAKDVVNGLHVTPAHPKQVQLKLRIVEVDRSRADQFGINIFTSGSRTDGGISTQQFPSTSTLSAGPPASISVSDPLNLFLYNFKTGLGVTLKDLESKQILQVLAEPTLTTLSGLPARFLSGGEFPVPVVQGGVGNSNAVSIMYRPYGVKVDFTPIVNGDGSIRLKVSPEVSTLDYTNSVTISGTTVPALSTRRAETEVEIRNGESFVVSGLLDHRTTDALGSVPGIAEIPILGQLFRSKNLNRSVVELVVMVTATIVDPLAQKLDTAEPQMVLPNMDTNVFDVRLKANANEKPASATQNGPQTQTTNQIQTPSVGKP